GNEEEEEEGKDVFFYTSEIRLKEKILTVATAIDFFSLSFFLSFFFFFLLLFLLLLREGQD
ncbi:hypothetical protein CSUI_008531, partial [Cystoisospora suis]